MYTGHCHRCWKSYLKANDPLLSYIEHMLKSHLKYLQLSKTYYQY